MHLMLVCGLLLLLHLGQCSNDGHGYDGSYALYLCFLGPYGM